MSAFDLFGKKKKLAEMQKAQIMNCQRILRDSLQIMSSTDNIDTFMSRYNTARVAVVEAAKIAGADTPCLAGISPMETLRTLDFDLPRMLNPCIDRYMRKQTVRISGLSSKRLEKAKGIHLIIDEYEKEMPPESITYWREAVEHLMYRIQKLENSAGTNTVTKTRK